MQTTTITMPVPVKKNVLKNHFEKFLHEENTANIILITLSMLSLLASNFFPFSADYVRLWYYDFSILDKYHLPHSPLLIINDVLMPFFFFTVGAEIKHDLTKGSLNTLKKASLPLVAALGGMVVPALLYAFFNKGTSSQVGWAIPTATDIAFSLAVLSILGKKIPREVKIFLMALAIFDDLGAIAIIAFFYGETIHPGYLLMTALIGFILYLTLNKKIKIPSLINYPLYILLGYGLHLSGLHTTLAGVIIALIMPSHLLHKNERFILHFVNFSVLPLFVLSNTAIAVYFGSEEFPIRVFLGIIFGLVIGKPLGVVLLTHLGVQRFKIVELPKTLTMHDILGIGILAGIGFTMSIFIANLSFTNTLISLETAKLSVIIASVIAAVTGYLWFSIWKNSRLIQVLWPQHSTKKITNKKSI